LDGSCMCASIKPVGISLLEKFFHFLVFHKTDQKLHSVWSSWTAFRLANAPSPIHVLHGGLKTGMQSWSLQESHIPFGSQMTISLHATACDSSGVPAPELEQLPESFLHASGQESLARSRFIPLATWLLFFHSG
jgi:hypothetical protein